jgi:hypothetical protein
MQTKPASFFEKSVRHVLLNSIVYPPQQESPEDLFSEEEDVALLRLCPRLLSFYCLVDHCKPVLLPILEGLLQARRWTGSLQCLFGSAADVDLRHPFFLSVTHMEIFEVDMHICAGLASMLTLTHLCLDENLEVAILAHVLDHCSNLQVLVNMFDFQGDAQGVADNPPVTDVRFVVVAIACHSYWDEWELGARAGVDFWVAADTFIARKRRREIDGTHTPSYLPCYRSYTPVVASCYLLDYTHQ